MTVDELVAARKIDRYQCAGRTTYSRRAAELISLVSGRKVLWWWPQRSCWVLSD